MGLVGTEGTDKPVNEEIGDGQYEHISVVKQVAKATFSSVAATFAYSDCILARTTNR